MALLVYSDRVHITVQAMPRGRKDVVQLGWWGYDWFMYVCVAAVKKDRDRFSKKISKLKATLKKVIKNSVDDLNGMSNQNESIPSLDDKIKKLDFFVMILSLFYFITFASLFCTFAHI